VFSQAFFVAFCKRHFAASVTSTGSITVAHPSKYFTSTPKKLIQLELMLFSGEVIA